MGDYSDIKSKVIAFYGYGRDPHGKEFLRSGFSEHVFPILIMPFVIMGEIIKNIRVARGKVRMLELEAQTA